MAGDLKQQKASVCEFSVRSKLAVVDEKENCDTPNNSSSR
jgi:hypothetical protein